MKQKMLVMFCRRVAILAIVFGAIAPPDAVNPNLWWQASLMLIASVIWTLTSLDEEREPGPSRSLTKPRRYHG